MRRGKPQGHKSSRRQQRRPEVDRTALVQIEKPIYGGAFLARLDGKATFVPLTLPGEQAQVRIIEEKRSFATAEPEQIIEASPNRVSPRCSHFSVCGGCSYQHANYETQLAWKEEILRETLTRGGVPVPEKIDTLSGEPWHYRNRIRLAFDDAAGRVGYRGRRSHQVISIKECPIAAPLLVNAALAAAECLRNLKQDFRPSEISLFCDAAETSLLAGMTVQNFTHSAFEAFAEAWKERIPSLAGIELLREDRQGQGASTVAQWGEASITYGAFGFDYHVENGAFFQVNRWLIDELVRRVVGSRTGALAWDLFAGVGLFARQLAKQFDEVIAVESASAAVRSLTVNLAGTAGRAVAADTLSFLKSHAMTRTPDLIVVDPPRAGLGPQMTALLSGIAAPGLVYVSCDPSTLARDLKLFTTSGYAVGSITLVDLFPQTFHLETLVELRRS